MKWMLVLLGVLAIIGIILWYPSEEPASTHLETAEAPLPPNHSSWLEETVVHMLDSLSLVGTHSGESKQVDTNPSEKGERRYRLPRGNEENSIVSQLHVLSASLKEKDRIVDVRFPIKTTEGFSATAVLTSHPPQVPFYVDMCSNGTDIESYQLFLFIDSTTKMRLASLRKIGDIL